MTIDQELTALIENFRKQASEAFRASGGDLEAYDAHISKATDSLLSGLLKKFECFNARIEQNSKEVATLRATVDIQAASIERLEKKVKAMEVRDKKSQKYQVKNNLIIRSTESVTSVSKFLLTTVQEGSTDGKKPAASSFTITQIRAPEEPEEGATPSDGPSRAIYRAVFKDTAHVKNFWKGVPVTNKSGSNIQVASEMPRYLKALYSDFERAAYTMRNNYKKDGLKTRVVTKNLSLKMQFRLPDKADWIDSDNTIIQDMIDIPLLYKRGEKVPNIHPTVRDTIKKADKHF